MSDPKPAASTSTSTYQTRAKRKSDTVTVDADDDQAGKVEDEAGGELDLAGSEDGNDDGQDESGDEHADKKVKDDKGKGKAKAKPKKKVLKKKVAVWTDIREWKEGDDPLGRFPVEVLDLIISVDSDLELRDHLALAATCRYFRSCYRDDVFQALFQVAFPNLAKYSPFLAIDANGKPRDPHDYVWEQPHGPFSRSISSARRIFSSGRSTTGAGGWTGWGLLPDEHKAQQLKTDKQQNEIERVLLADAKLDTPLTWTDEMDEEFSCYWRTYGVETDEFAQQMRDNTIKRELASAEKKRLSDLERIREVFGLERHALDPSMYHRYLHSVEDKTEYDPWPSTWRKKVVKVVNVPVVTKTEAKAKYKVSDRELLSLTERHPQYAPKNAKYYSKAAVEALALRSHGGQGGHKEHLAKLEVRKAKAHQTRVKNGTLVVAKPKPPTRRERMVEAMAMYEENPAMFLQMFGGYDDYSGTDDDMDGYGSDY